jgi:surface antigen
MMNGTILRGLCVAALAIGALPVAAQNFHGLMKDSPAEKFNDEDMRLFNQAAAKALTEAAVGETVRWENPVSQNRGEMQVQKIFTWKDHPCRQVRVRNQAGDRKASNSLNVCRVSDKWRLVSPSELKKG